LVGQSIGGKNDRQMNTLKNRRRFGVFLQRSRGKNTKISIKTVFFSRMKIISFYDKCQYSEAAGAARIGVIKQIEKSNKPVLIALLCANVSA
jgi:hypothetical protein